MCALAAEAIARAMKQTADLDALHWLANGLSMVAARMTPAEAVATFAEAETLGSQAMSETTTAPSVYT